ncbi:MAG TPA: CPXCG motif-containing cysteine-rich protein [Thermoanaerobaculia bacterium]|nr:CPXCG motif-containing cysteine-rich protein [Thermoanaerobaculia bacterium]
MDTWYTVRCAWCGELFDIDIDPTAARTQRYVEDCAVCCRPNAIQVEIDERGDAQVTTERE